MSSKNYRCPLCNCILHSALTDKFEIVYTCSNHKFDGYIRSISFKDRTDMHKLDKLIEVIKQKRLTVRRETVGWQNFLVEHNIQI